MWIKEMLRKTWEENQAGYKRIEEEKREKEIEQVIQERFQAERDELTALSEELSQKSAKLERRKIAVDEYIKQRSRELGKKEAQFAEHQEMAILDIKRYQDALYRTESMIIDWLKRADRKEIAIFDEIQTSLETFQKYNQTPPADGFEFEEYFGNLLTLNGFQNVNVTQRSQDFGADVLAEKDGIKYVFQCKYYTHPVGVAAVQQVFASKIHYFAHVAIVATNSVFTKAAKTLADESGVLLWDCEKIAELEKQSPSVD